MVPDHRDDLIGVSRRLRGVAAAAARSVGPMLREAFRAPLEVAVKSGPQDLVTEHDRAAERTILRHVLRAHPDSRVLGEEGGTQGAGRVLWLVDPIDGTTNFAHGLPHFCVSVAAVLDEELVAGAIYDPIAEQMFTADLTGAWRDGAPLRSRGAPTADQAIILSDYPAGRDLARGPVAEVTFGALAREFRSVRRGGSGALALAYTAAGWVDCTFATSTNPWDIGAGALLVQQAGGRYLAFGADGEPVTTALHEAPNYVAFAGDADYPQVTALVRGR